MNITREKAYIENIIPDQEAAKQIIALFEAIATQNSPHHIVATAVSQTTDFAFLAVGDIVKHYLQVDDTVTVRTIAVAGDLGEAAVVADLYEVIR